MPSKCIGLSWLGVKTEKFDEMKTFYGEHLGLSLVSESEGFAMFQADNGDAFEIFDADRNEYPHFSSAPVAGFQVEDIEAAKKELEGTGIEFIGDIGGSKERSRWAHFRGPDGNIYELKWHASP